MTHMLTGAVLGRAGFHKRAAYATVAMAIAAEFPDCDYLWWFQGPVALFEHHRGITHTFVGVPFEAAFLTAAFYVLHRLRKQPKTAAPARWGWLFAGIFLALLSHLLLDWTNNYGVRPLFPFDPHWFAGSFVFIFEPVLFAILVAALVLPGLFGLVNAEVGARRRAFVGSGWAWAALLLVGTLYGFRFDEHAKALQLAAQNGPADATAYFASPHPINPFVWSTVAETAAGYQLSTVNTWAGSGTGEASVPVPSDTLYRPTTSLALLAAKRTALGKVFLDWSKAPVLSEETDRSDPKHPVERISFRDARFLYDTSFNPGREHPPLSGYVLLDMEAPEGQRVMETEFDGRMETQK